MTQHAAPLSRTTPRQQRGPRVRAGLAALAFAVAVTGGCGSPERDTTTEEGASGAPSESPRTSGDAAPQQKDRREPPEVPPTTIVVTSPQRPAEMERNDDVGAEAAAGYFMELYSYVVQTGDFEEWNVISAQGCDFCDAVRSDIEATYARGHRIIGRTLVHQGALSLNQDPVIGGFLVEVPVQIAEGREIDDRGRLVMDLPAENRTAYMDTIYSAPGWMIVEVGLDPQHAIFAPCEIECEPSP